MGNDREKGPFLTISTLAIILAALGVTIFNQHPFQGERPPVPEIREPAKVSARLWQDPYQAVLDHLKASNRINSARKDCKFSIYSSNASNRCAAGKGCDPLKIRDRMDKGKVTVLGVMVSGNRFAASCSLRRGRGGYLLEFLTKMNL